MTMAILMGLLPVVIGSILLVVPRWVQCRIAVTTKLQFYLQPMPERYKKRWSIRNVRLIGIFGIIIGVVTIFVSTQIASGVFVLGPTPMHTEALVRLKAQILRDIIEKHHILFRDSVIPTNDLVFVAFGKQGTEWIEDPPTSVICDLSTTTHYRCFPASEISKHIANAQRYWVFYVDTRWEPQDKAYDFVTGLYEDRFPFKFDPTEVWFEMGGEIRRSWFRWKYFLLGYTVH